VNAEEGPATATDDLSPMRAALALARRNLGSVWPNPAVGCVLVRDRIVVGRGTTQPGGRPHAETQALDSAGAAARGATAFVSLEPCSHHGMTPPCAEALVAAGIGRAVVAVADPDPRVAGAGIRRLRAAGIPVTVGVLADEATELNAGFFLRCREGRPLFTLKLATTLDGRIATAGGESRWITGETARAMAHRLRALHDAVLVGSATVLADDPLLTCRLPGLERPPPVRIVADRRLRLPPSARLAATARETPTWVVTGGDAPTEKREALTAAGVSVIALPAMADPRAAAQAMATALAERGLTRVLIEGGGGIAASFLAADLVDRVEWFRAPRIVGGDGLAAIASFGLERLAAAPAFVRRGLVELDGDLLESYVRSR
jgi:diaminohydroxyphosphoribosylaminopyrimidine deaminase/5-amino-6-(5-phosphoribosylamino)uracil reductase